MSYPEDFETLNKLKNRENCCFSVPIRPGVFMLLILFMLRSVVGVILLSFLFGSADYFLILFGIYLLFLIGFSVGLVAMHKKSPKLYLFAPATAILHLALEGVWAYWIGSLTHLLRTGKWTFESLITMNYTAAAGIVTTCLICSIISSVYYIGVFFRFFAVIKREKNQENLNLVYSPEY